MLFSRSFITGSYDRTCKVWDTLSGEELFTLEGHRNVVYAIGYNNPFGYVHAWCITILPARKVGAFLQLRAALQRTCMHSSNTFASPYTYCILNHAAHVR